MTVCVVRRAGAAGILLAALLSLAACHSGSGRTTGPYVSGGAGANIAN